MAESINSPQTVPITATITCEASAGDLTEISIKGFAGTITLYFVGGPGKYSHVGVDAAAIGTDYQVIPGDQLIEIILTGEVDPVFYIAHTLAGGTCHVAVERGC